MALAAALLLTTSAYAQSEAFKISGGGVGTQGLPLPTQPARPHWAIGEGTHLGRYYGEGSVQTDNVAPTATGFAGNFGGGSPFVFTGANGDKLVCWYGRADHGASAPGTFELTVVGFTPSGAPIVTAKFIAEFVVQPSASTGKFAGVTGSWIMYAQTEPFVLGSSDPVAYTWEGKGRLNFAHR
jgi:hypothetical protein